MSATSAWATPAAAKPRVYKSERFEYSLEVPHGWRVLSGEHVPSATANRLRKAFLAKAGDPTTERILRAVHLDVVMFGPGKERRAVAYVMAADFADARVPSDKIDDFGRGVTESRANAQGTREVDFHKGIPAIKAGENVLSDSVPSTSVTSPMSPQGRTIMRYKVGQTKLVIFGLVIPKGVDAQAARQRLLQSFRLAANEVNTCSPEANPYFKAGERAANAVYSVVILALVIGAIIEIQRRWQARRMRKFAEQDDE